MPRLLTMLAALTLPIAALAPSAGAQEEAPLRVLFTMTGRTSDVVEPRYELATTQEAFDKVWTEHMGERVERAGQGWAMPPRADFESTAVVFIFGGRSFNSNGFTIEGVSGDRDAASIRFDAITYQTAAAFGEVDHGDSVTPWLMAVIERPTGGVVLEENVQGLIGGDPIWRERAKFSPVGEPAAQRIGAADLLELEPRGQIVALEAPISRTRYMWVDANPTDYSWEGIGVRVSDDPRDDRTVWARVRPSLHERIVVDPEVGGLEHLRTADGGTLVLASNDAYQQRRSGRLRLIGRWHAGRNGPVLIVDAITEVERSNPGR